MVEPAPANIAQGAEAATPTQNSQSSTSSKTNVNETQEHDSHVTVSHVDDLRIPSKKRRSRSNVEHGSSVDLSPRSPADSEHSTSVSQPCKILHSC